MRTRMIDVPDLCYEVATNHACRFRYLDRKCLIHQDTILIKNTQGDVIPCYECANADIKIEGEPK